MCLRLVAHLSAENRRDRIRSVAVLPDPEESTWAGGSSDTHVFIHAVLVTKRLIIGNQKSVVYYHGSH